ncbi:hypothetical protein [Gelatiniphilus marinus]|uniref:OmpA-like domain-containing protein n=1 Tax=Gelatiniphilus marinus TaxID=1759464 RepID=A0ABW5JQ31_9FLAO
MKGYYLLLIASLLFITKTAFSQNTFDIIINAKDRDKKCKACNYAFRQKPKEVRYSISRENNDLFFEINDVDWFHLVFKNPNDGISLDIVLKDRYDCGNTTKSKTQIKGLLLKPVYAQELKNGLLHHSGNVYRVKVGEVPRKLRDYNLEYNILFIGNNNLCQYYVTYDLDYYAWDLLDMGMYLDQLTYNVKQIKAFNTESYSIRNKKLKFIIPFKKNKTNYSKALIKPIYDSLSLTDFEIKTLKIKAYSSIEGITKRNIELQERRANSIVEALQAYQKPTIKTNVSASENWVEFFNDIKGTKYEYLKSQNKNQVRKSIAGAVSREMEPILKNHRKAVVELELEKKEKSKGQSVNRLLAEFNRAIAQDDIEKAKIIQNSIFQKVKTRAASSAILHKMKVPQEAKYAKIINKNAAYRYILDKKEALIVHGELLDLKKLAPRDIELQYNILAIEIMLWRYNAIDIQESKLIKKINNLKKGGIPKPLISRMKVNFHMVIADKFMKNRDFDNKDKSVEYVNRNYKKFPLSDYDFSSLAQFYSIYANSNLAVKLLERKARTIDIDEDLLFYYLNLTLVNKSLTQDPDYRTIMLNAINMNKTRFCNLFNAVEDGGVTFQLLEDEYIRETYCENCND